MKVLVTGGAGFIGSHIVDLLLKKGYKVRILDSLEPPVHVRSKKPSYIPDDVEFIVGDVRDISDLQKAVKGVDIIFHLAAYQGYLTDFSKFAFTNDGSTALIYEIITRKRLPIKKIILASSQAVYGEGKYECPTHSVQYPCLRSLEQLLKGEWELKCPICGQAMEPISSDEAMVHPHNQYAISKYCQELYALNLGRRFGIPTTVLRYSIIQGPRQSFYNAYSGILRIFTTRHLNGLPLVIYEDGKQLRDYVYVGDAAKANLLVMENESTDFEIFNVGGEKAITVLEYAKVFQEVVRQSVTPETLGKFRFGDTRHVFSDTAKLKKLGWQSRTPLKQIITEYIDWVRKQAEVPDYYAEAEKVMKDEGVIRISEVNSLRR